MTHQRRAKVHSFRKCAGKWCHKGQFSSSPLPKVDGRTEQQQAANNSVTPFNFVTFSFSSSSCTLLFLSCCHCEDIPDRCGGSLDTSSSSNIYFCVSPRAAGSCVSVPVSELRATEICILYHAVCLFSHSTSSKCHWEKC